MTYTARKRIRTACRIILPIICAALMLAMIVGVYDMRKYYIISLAVALMSIGFFFVRFEGRRPKSRDIVIPAVLTGIAVVSRLILFTLPQFKPIAAVVIIAGVAFGAETGFMTGSLSMLISNMFLGQGIWTPWQMLGLGLVGFLAGLIFKSDYMKRPWIMAAYGFLSVMTVYGFIADTYSAFGFMYELSIESILATYIAGIPFNTVFAFCTALTLFIFGKPVIKKLERVKLKYGFM